MKLPHTPPAYHRKKQYRLHCKDTVLSGKVNNHDGLWVDPRFTTVSNKALDFSRSGAAHRKVR